MPPDGKQRRADRGRAALNERGLGYPGGDDLRFAECVGLARLRKVLDHYGEDRGTPWDIEERLALKWLDAWIDAGTPMLPPELWRPEEDDDK